VAESSVVANEDAPNRIRSMFLASQDALRTIEQNLVNRTLLARVIRAEGLAEDNGEALLGRNKAAVARLRPHPESANSKAEPPMTPLEESLAGALSGMVKPVIRRGTRLIDLYVVNTDPTLAQRLAEAVGREYIRSSIERRASTTQDTLRYLLEEEERLKANLQKSEAAVAEYKAKTPDALQLGGGTASTGSQPGAGAGSNTRGGLVEDKLQELSSKLTAAKTERLRLEGELNQIKQAGEDIDVLLSVPSIANAPIVTDRRREVAQLQSAVASLSQRYKEKHPKMMAAKAALTEAQEGLKRAVLDQPAVLNNSLEQARNAEQSLQSALREQEQAAIALNRAAIGYQELARQAETDRALYESVLRQIKATDLTKGVKANAVSVVERSPAPNIPISPNTTKSLALGLLGGLAAGLGIIFGANALDRSLKTVDQVETTLALPVLAAIPEVPKSEGTTEKTRAGPDASTASYRLVAEAPEGPAAEAFRNLRASLSLLGPEEERKVFLFTSALPGEGKSFTSANYSLALAQQGYRVLLIDGDLRRPSLQKIFLRNPVNGVVPEEGHGVVDYLVGSVSLGEAVHAVAASEVDIIGEGLSDDAKSRTARGGQLSILAGGTRAPNPAELLSGHCFADLIAKASAVFDRVVIDSAPVLAVSDTLLMTAHVQSVCIVVRAGETARNAVHRALGLIAATGVRPAGVVLNRLPRTRGTGYYYYYASHGYGAGEGSYGSYGGRPRTRKSKVDVKQNGAGQS
jgi:polysaccharide biosynthesis transport protein